MTLFLCCLFFIFAQKNAYSRYCDYKPSGVEKRMEQALFAARKRFLYFWHDKSTKNLLENAFSMPFCFDKDTKTISRNQERKEFLLVTTRKQMGHRISHKTDALGENALKNAMVYPERCRM